MSALVLMDALLAQQARETARSLLPSLKYMLPVNGTGTSADTEKVLNGETVSR